MINHYVFVWLHMLSLSLNRKNKYVEGKKQEKTCRLKLKSKKKSKKKHTKIIVNLMTYAFKTTNLFSIPYFFFSLCIHMYISS
jgi:hypothetical protein